MFIWRISGLKMNASSKDKSICVGTRVSTDFGVGTVVGASINIKYDCRHTGKHQNDRVWSHNLIEFE